MGSIPGPVSVITLAATFVLNIGGTVPGICPACPFTQNIAGRYHMKFATRLAGILAILVAVSACATTPVTDPEKYNFDDQLERVTMIDKFTMSGWNRIDTQSFVLQSGSSDWYLIVLKIPSYDLPFAEGIQIQASGSMVRAGNSSVIVQTETSRNYFTIDKIYKFKDAGESQPVIDQIMEK